MTTDQVTDQVEVLIKGIGAGELGSNALMKSGKNVSKWFQRYKKRCGIEQGKSFHSFRHTFITHLKHKQVDPFMIHELDGHTIQSETIGRYGKRQGVVDMALTFKWPGCRHLFDAT